MQNAKDFFRSPNDIRRCAGNVAIDSTLGLKRPVKKQENSEAKRRRQSTNMKIQGASGKVYLSKKD